LYRKTISFAFLLWRLSALHPPFVTDVSVAWASCRLGNKECGKLYNIYSIVICCDLQLLSQWTPRRRTHEHCIGVVACRQCARVSTVDPPRRKMPRYAKMSYCGMV